MTNFTDQAHAAELAAFAPVKTTPGGRIAAERAVEVIAVEADFAERILPAVERWIAERER